MKRATWLAGLAAAGFVASGCGGGALTKEEWDAFKQSHESKNKEQDEAIAKKAEECNTRINNEVNKLLKEFNEAVAEYTAVKAKLQDMKDVLVNFEKLKADLEAKIGGIDAKVTTANANLITALEAESKLLEDRLVELKRTIEDLKKPK